MFAQSETSVKPGKPFKVTSRMLSQDSPVGPKKLSGQSRNASSNPIQGRDEVRKRVTQPARLRGAAIKEAQCPMLLLCTAIQ